MGAATRANLCCLFQLKFILGLWVQVRATLDVFFYVKSVENHHLSPSLLDSLAVHLYNSARVSEVAKCLEIKLNSLIDRM